MPPAKDLATAWGSFAFETDAEGQLGPDELRRAEMIFATGYQAGLHAAMQIAGEALKGAADALHRDLAATAEALGITVEDRDAGRRRVEARHAARH